MLSSLSHCMLSDSDGYRQMKVSDKDMPPTPTPGRKQGVYNVHGKITKIFYKKCKLERATEVETNGNCIDSKFT